MIDVRQLTYFVAVVEAKSFTAAAETLHVAQPALSQHLQRLEYEFGQQLLIRHSRGVVPTPAGVRLVEHARVILTLVQAAKDDLRNFDKEPHGVIRVGMPRSLCDIMAVELMTNWSESYPKINLQIVEQSSNTLTEWVMAGRLDLAITSFPSDSGSVIAEPLLQDKMCAIMPRRDGSSSDIGQIRFADLAQEPLALYSPSNQSRQLLDMTAKYCDVNLNIAFEVDSPDLALRLVEAGKGSTIQPYLAVRHYLESGRADIRLIVGPGITRRLHLIRSKNRPLAHHEAELCKAIKTHLANGLATDKHESMLELDFAVDTPSDI